MSLYYAEQGEIHALLEKAVFEAVQKAFAEFADLAAAGLPKIQASFQVLCNVDSRQPIGDVCYEVVLRRTVGATVEERKCSTQLVATGIGYHPDTANARLPPLTPTN